MGGKSAYFEIKGGGAKPIISCTKYHLSKFK